MELETAKIELMDTIRELQKELAEERAGRPLLAKATDTINELETILNALGGQDAVKLNAECDELGLKVAQATDRIAQLEAEIATLKMSPDWIDELAQVRAERDALKATIDEDILSNNRMAAECRELKAERDALRAENEWISVAEKLPEDENRVLIYADEIIYTAWYDHRVKSWVCYSRIFTVTHWRNLPQPPEGAK